MMTHDAELRARLTHAAESIPDTADAALHRFHTFRPRRQAARRVATIVTALGLAAIVALVAVVAMPSGDRDGSPGTPTGVPGAGDPAGAIAYTSIVGTGEATAIKEMTLGSDQPSVLFDDAFVFAPQWSPDGTQVLYGSGAASDDNLELTVAAADGSDPVGLGLEIGVSTAFSWSPDGTRIAYIRGDESPEGFDTVAIAGADGTGGRAVLPGVAWQSVSWSPDGERLLVVGHPPNEEGIAGPEGWDIYTANTDGTDLTQVTHTDEWEHLATWSPDGTQILFTRSTGSSDDADYPSDVWVMNADGSEARALTEWRGFDAFPVWSPDGRWIAFASDREASTEEQAAFRRGDAISGVSLFVMRPDGTDVRRILTAGQDEALIAGSWRP
jgi:Tol biopolymer transport system component